MVLFCLFSLFLSLMMIFLLSPVVIRYARDTEGVLSLHFVFFSLSFYKARKEGEGAKAEEKEVSEGKRPGVPRAVFHALRYARRRAEICLYSLPIPQIFTPDRAALLSGTYYALISAFSILGRITTDPLLDAKTQPNATIDCRIKIRTFALLYTFLIFLVQYRKEKEAMKHGRHEN